MSTKKKFRIKKGDTVQVITGRSKGQTGLVRQIDYAKGKLIVEGVNTVKKAIKANPLYGIKGGFMDKEAPIDISNVMYYDTASQKPSRIVYSKNDAGKKVRVIKRTAAVIEE